MHEDFMNPPVGDPVANAKEQIDLLDHRLRELKRQQGIIQSDILAARKERKKYERILSRLEQDEQ